MVSSTRTNTADYGGTKNNIHIHNQYRHYRHSNHHPKRNRRTHDGDDNNSNSNNNIDKNTILLRGAVWFHKVGEFAILAVIAIGITTIPFAFLSVVVPTTHALVAPLGASTRWSPPGTGKRATTPAPFFVPQATRGPLGAASAPGTTSTTGLSRIDPSDLETLRDQGYVVIEDFLPDESVREALREDVLSLRKRNKFRVAKIGQDATNTLNQEIRVAETCFLGPDKPELRDAPSEPRERLYEILENLRADLEGGESGGGPGLDPGLSEFLYAYYPEGGFYRRHRDAVKGSPSWLREYSLLLYLNDDSYDAETDGGRLRVHFDTGGDFLPPGEAPLFQDVDATGGTLVLFESDRFPHEVLDTVSERFAVVGWYNRPMSLGDLSAIGGGSGSAALGDDPATLAALAVAAALVTVGLINILS
mmetsp:Transcript_118568/g.242291  ORF Transcript_118568/g.242291 Transcript_118568/m.242291 type:complete len:419 (-) Transcript_118568:394-1650(-)